MIIDNEYKKLKEFEEYTLLYNNKSYQFLINKIEEEKSIIIKCGEHKIKLYLEEIIKKTKIYLESIEDVYKLILNLFKSNKVIILDLINENIMKISFKIYNNIINKEEDILFYLQTENKDKDKVLDDILYKYNILQNEVIKLKEENKKNNELLNLLLNEIKDIKKENILFKNEINELKNNYGNKNCSCNDNYINNNNKEDNYISKNNINNFKTEPNLINYSVSIIKDAYGYYEMDNTFIVFNSFNGISHIIYVKENNSIINYNLTEEYIIAEIKNPHEKMITNFNHYLDKIKKIDLIMSISAEDCNIKIWNLNNWECILYLNHIYLTGCLFSSCFINDNNNVYIVTSNCADSSGTIKIYNFNNEILKIIDNSNDETYFIDVYYENKINKIFIITGNKGYVKSYDYYNNKLYKKYYDSDLNKSHDSVVVSKYKEKEEIINLIDSCQNGFISIWNFHLGILLHKINIGYNYLEGICLWNEKYIFVGGGDNSIKLIEIKNGLIIKSLKGHNENVLSIKKNDNKKYGECLISQGNDGNIKLWIHKV